MSLPTDRELGLHRHITRRDFVHDVSLAGLGLALPWPALAHNAADGGTPYYPPTLTGLRGSHAGAFEIAHAPRARRKAVREPADARRSLRPDRGRRRHQRARRGVLLPQAPRPAVADPDPRQPRRLRRTRQAQRVPPGRPDAPRLGRHREHGVPEVQRRRDGPVRELGIDIPRLREDYTFNWMGAAAT